MTEWISIKEQIPKDKQYCLFCDGIEITSGKFRHAKYNFIQDFPGSCGCSGIEIDTITHWMPLA